MANAYQPRKNNNKQHTHNHHNGSNSSKRSKNSNYQHQNSKSRSHKRSNSKKNSMRRSEYKASSVDHTQPHYSPPPRHRHHKDEHAFHHHHHHQHQHAHHHHNHSHYNHNHSHNHAHAHSLNLNLTHIQMLNNLTFGVPAASNSSSTVKCGDLFNVAACSNSTNYHNHSNNNNNNNNNKRRSSYSEATPEAQEIEDHNADYIASTESVSSQQSNSVVTNGDGMHSDSMLNISDKESVAVQNARKRRSKPSCTKYPNQHNGNNKSSHSSSSLCTSSSSASSPSPSSSGAATGTRKSKHVRNARENASKPSTSSRASRGHHREAIAIEKRMKSAVMANSAAPPIKVNGLKYTASSMMTKRATTTSGNTQMIESTQLECDFLPASPALMSNYYHPLPASPANLNYAAAVAPPTHHMNNGLLCNSNTMMFDDYMYMNNSHNMPYHLAPPPPRLRAPHLSAPLHSIYNGHVFGGTAEYNSNCNTASMMGYPPELNMHADPFMLQQQQQQSVSVLSTSPSNESIYPYYLSESQLPTESVPQPPPPPPPLAPAAPREVTKFVCIDVECAATGYGHFDQAPCRIAMTDFYGEIMFDRICKVPNLMDPLKEFTGLTAREINDTRGAPLKEVLAEFHAMLKKLNQRHEFGVTIVGQSLVMDLIWTKLQKGVHYTQTIDIAHEFKTKHKKWSKETFYSLRQVAWALLQCNMNQHYHDPTEDARVTMQLYRMFCLRPTELKMAQQRLQRLKEDNAFPDFRVKIKFPQCSAMYSPSRCKCGQKTAAHCNGVQDLDKLRKLYIEHQAKPVKHRSLSPLHPLHHHRRHQHSSKH